MNENKTKSYTKSHASITKGGSALKRYQNVIVGNNSWRSLLYFEFCIWLAGIPGALGIFLRKIFWPRLFGSCGRGALFSSHIILRHPHRIHLGDNVIVSERCVLDARTMNTDKVITLGDNVILSNDVALVCKGGTIEVGDDVGIGTQTVIHSTYDCSVVIEKDTMIAPQCFLIAGGTYNTKKRDIPMRLQGVKKETGIHISQDVWIGAKVSVLSEVNIGAGSIVGAGSTVTRNIEPFSVCVGSPSRKIKER